VYLVSGRGTGFHPSLPNALELSKPYDPSSNEDIRQTGSPLVTFLNALRPREELTTKDLKSGCLACWTSVAAFQLIGDKLDLGEGSIDWEDHNAFIISDQNRSLCERFSLKSIGTT
jgi:hypothetical protein